MSASDPKRIVEEGYDGVAERYAEWSQTEVEGSPSVTYLERLIEVLPEKAVILELGCGNGEPGARMLAAGHLYTGIDLSNEQLRRARALIPDADFLKADYTQLAWTPDSADAVVALYTFGHVPQGELPGLLSRIATWLVPGGHLLATMGSRDHPDGIYDWLGVPMFFSGFGVQTNLRLIADTGLELVEHEVVCQDEGEEGNPCFLWVLARRPE